MVGAKKSESGLLRESTRGNPTVLLCGKRPESHPTLTRVRGTRWVRAGGGWRLNAVGITGEHAVLRLFPGIIVGEAWQDLWWRDYRYSAVRDFVNDLRLCINSSVVALLRPHSHVLGNFDTFD